MQGYSQTWIDGKKHARNVYAHTREECEEKLKVLIAEMKTELAELKRQKAKGALSPQEPEKDKRCRQDLDLLTKAKILLKPTVVPAEQ